MEYLGEDKQVLTTKTDAENTCYLMRILKRRTSEKHSLFLEEP